MSRHKPMLLDNMTALNMQRLVGSLFSKQSRLTEAETTLVNHVMDVVAPKKKVVNKRPKVLPPPPAHLQKAANDVMDNPTHSSKQVHAEQPLRGRDLFYDENIEDETPFIGVKEGNGVPLLGHGRSTL